jgi:FtsP/CotA-like multicopper oxidase with cupredoxin domain
LNVIINYMRLLYGFLLVSTCLLMGCTEPEATTAPKPAPTVDEQPLPPPALPDVDGLTSLEDKNSDPAVVEVDLVARPTVARVLRGELTELLLYNDVLPGPLLHARVGDRVIVHFTNELDEPTVIHWHGLQISDQMDGSPRIQSPVEPGGTFTYDFVVPDAGTYWYHTHLHQIEQFERGLYGAIVVHEVDPPVFSAERLFVVDDIRLDEENQISDFLTSGPDIGRGRVGNTLLVNGRGSPKKLAIKRGSIERWRVVLATNALSFGMRVKGADVRVIATDGGLLSAPFTLDRVEIAPGQRYDLEVRPHKDATEVSLEALILVLDENDNVVEEPYPLAVAEVEGETEAAEPAYPIVVIPSTEVEAEQINWNLSGAVVDGKVEFTINDQPGFVGDDHDHPLLHTFEKDVPVRIKIRSNVSPGHPFHIHGQFFQILERAGKPVFEPGLRDTVEVRGSQSVTILSYFDNPGRWMVHCHISEHSENGMMAEVQVGAPHQHP